MRSFTSNELRVFRSICQGDDTVKKISKSTGLSLKPVYNLLGELADKGIVNITAGKPRRFKPGGDLHASALRRFLIEDEHPIDSIVGSKFLILLSITHHGKTEKKIAEETGLKPSSVRRLILQLQYYGLVDKHGNETLLSPSARSMNALLSDFSAGYASMMVRQKSKDGILLWDDGLHFLFSATELNDPSGVMVTGISAMAAYGIDFFTPKEYYYFTYGAKNGAKKLDAVDIALHAMLVDPTSPRAIGDAMLLLKKKGIKKELLLREAESVGLKKRALQIVDFFEGKDIDDPTFPSQADVESLFMQYGVA